MKRKYYIDNLRILLTCLVVVHHLAITYGGPGLWYYNEANTDPISSTMLALFVASNQSFFMGMFFMISAFFLEKSMRNKTSRTLALDRIKRLGIPLLFYAFLISPIIIYLKSRFVEGEQLSLLEFIYTKNWLTFGPLWFVLALLIFTLFALGIRELKLGKLNFVQKKLPPNHVLLLSTLCIALISFVVRIWMPVGWTLKPLGFQLAHFPQYIILYFIGFHASKSNWFDQITYRQSKASLKLVALLVFLVFPLVFYFGGALSAGPEIFMGGFNLQSFSYCIWEQLAGIGIIIGLLGIWRERYNTQSPQLKTLSASAYTVYIIHALVLVSISLAIRNLALSPTAKFLLVSPLALIICFFLANYIRKLPLARKVL